MKKLSIIICILFAGNAYSQRLKTELKPTLQPNIKMNLKGISKTAADSIRKNQEKKRIAETDYYSEYSELLFGAAENNAWIELDKGKQILNFSVARYGKMSKYGFGNITGNLSNTNTPLFANGNFKPRDYTLQFNYNLPFKKSKYVASTRDGRILEPIKVTKINLFWINVQPEFAHNSYDFITPENFSTFKVQQKTFQDFNGSFSINGFSKWNDSFSEYLPDWGKLRKWRPAYFFFNAGVQYKRVTNAGDLDQWDIETRQSYTDVPANETRSKTSTSKAFAGNIESTRSLVCNAQLAVGFRNNTFIDCRYYQEFVYANSQNITISYGGVFRDSNKKVKTVAGLYVKFSNTNNPVIGITTKKPF